MWVSAKELRHNVFQLLEAVMQGKAIIIIHKGKPCTRLVPYENQTEEDDLFGVWADHPQSENVTEYVRKIRNGRYP